MPIDQTQIMRHLVPKRTGKIGAGQNFAYVKYHLAHMIMRQHHFRDIAALIEFCSKPENLKVWLPSSEDRRIIAAALAASLRAAAPSTPI